MLYCNIDFGMTWSTSYSCCRAGCMCEFI